ncbi:sodium-dependent transporter [Methanobrevibacter sp.]|uniref:sodium-dependent transporter n=1 Tax=Methanobrevibacter sp. TaxID=66852 RepID=UPI0025D7B502|nr:sodium-dependent transporter [Methanobrevibacter sp.]MBQ2666106.1 sodium-dependent transporter [Methanobrevibacter sp.]
MANQNQWDSSLSFLLAMIGAAVGLGNIWRFSYVVYSNGGGSFFIPYLVAIAIMGIPFLVLEYGIGYNYKDSFSNILKEINPKLEFVSWMLVIFVFIVVIYYVVILSWDLIYVASSITFPWGNDPAAFFVQNVAGGSNLSNMAMLMIPTSISLLIMGFLLWFISHRDLNEGIGKASRILIPLLFCLMFFIIVYAFTLPGAGVGIVALLNPDWSMLFNINIWLAAFSQIIFSLSIGQAIALTYASYLPEGSKLNDNVLIVVLANCSFEVFTALGIFSILGYMSATAGTPIVQLVSEGTGLVFVVFPMIFNVMGPIGHILSPLLFLSILFAGITSAVAIFEPMVNSTLHKFDWSRKKTVTVLSVIGCAFSLLFTTGISSYLVGVVDGFVNEFCILFLIVVQSIIFAWIYDLDSLIPVLNENSKFKVGKIWKFNLRYVLPVFVLLMWAIGVFELISNSNNFEMTIYVVIAVAVLIVSGIFSKIKS